VIEFATGLGWAWHGVGGTTLTVLAAAAAQRERHGQCAPLARRISSAWRHSSAVSGTAWPGGVFRWSSLIPAGGGAF